MSKGFVTFSDIYFLPLVEILAESLLSFSSYPLHLFLINSDKQIDLPNVIVSNIKIPDKYYHHQLMFSKFYAAINNDFDFGCILDADMIANINIDDLLNFAEIHCQELPLPAFHGDNIINEMLMKYIGVNKPTMPYIHATYLFSKNSKRFLKECFNLSQKLIKEDIIFGGSDEILLNCMLWKYNSNKYLNSYDPYYKAITDYFANNNKGQWTRGRKEVSFNVFHGCKNVSESLLILNRLKKQDMTKFLNNRFQNKNLKLFLC